MDLNEIEAATDSLLEQLASTTSAGEVRDLCFRLDGFYRGAQVKVLAQTMSPAGRCGYRWTWPDSGGSHSEICTKPAGHVGTLHYNGVTGMSTPRLGEKAEPTKPAADRLHELASHLHQAAEKAREVSDRTTSEREEGKVEAYQDAFDKLEEILKEGTL